MKPSTFVFGSNQGGRHSLGAAADAHQYHGARYGVGEGLTGNSYALPTKDAQIRTRPLADVKASVDTFLRFAEQHPEMLFKVTRIGCGLAGFKDHQIAPLFEGAPPNCGFDPQWASYGLKTWAELEIG